MKVAGEGFASAGEHDFEITETVEGNRFFVWRIKKNLNGNEMR